MPVQGQPISVSGLPVPSCDLFTYAEALVYVGPINTANYSNKDGIKDPATGELAVDLASVQQSMNVAQDKVRDSLRNGIYVWPLDWSPNGSQIPWDVKRHAMGFYAEDLYHARGNYDAKDKEGDRWSKAARDAEQYFKSKARNYGDPLPARLDASRSPKVTSVDPAAARNSVYPTRQRIFPPQGAGWGRFP